MWHIQRDTTYMVLVGKLVRNRTFGRPRGRWKDNIKMVLKEKGWKVWNEFIWLGIGASGKHL
jgi:hypothetical protein